LLHFFSVFVAVCDRPELPTLQVLTARWWKDTENHCSNRQ